MDKLPTANRPNPQSRQSLLKSRPLRSSVLPENGLRGIPHLGTSCSRCVQTRQSCQFRQRQIGKAPKGTTLLFSQAPSDVDNPLIGQAIVKAEIRSNHRTDIDIIRPIILASILTRESQSRPILTDQNRLLLPQPCFRFNHASHLLKRLTRIQNQGKPRLVNLVQCFHCPSKGIICIQQRGIQIRHHHPRLMLHPHHSLSPQRSDPD